MTFTDYQLLVLAISSLTLCGVGYLVIRLPRTTVRTKQRAILVDTSVLMDGRIAAIAGTGFVGGALVIPRSVIGELQLLADGADSDRRARARRGLDLVSELQQAPGVEVEILQDSVRADEGVDNRLLTLAKRHKTAICTLDYNLNKVAVVEGIRVLNINELAQSLRMSHLPGERITIELTQKGQDNHQGVGHLTDGTMVVVEQASSRIGQTLEVEVIRSLQTAAGRMMFARIVDKPLRSVQQPKKHQPTVTNPQPQQMRRTKQPRTSASRPRQNKETQAPTSAAVTHDRLRPAKGANTTARATAQPNSARRRPPTQRDREAALIDLVDRQS
jgi:rRNA-processing protein FCF1